MFVANTFGHRLHGEGCCARTVANNVEVIYDGGDDGTKGGEARSRSFASWDD